MQVGDWAILGGFTVVHQFVRIGAHSFTGMGTYLAQDLAPYVTAAGNPAKPYGINSEGLRRREFDAATINPGASLITGSVCGVKVQEVKDPLMRNIRYLDKLVDELAKGRPMDKVLRS